MGRDEDTGGGALRSQPPARDAGWPRLRRGADPLARRLAMQWWVGRLLAPLWVPLAVLVMRLGFGWRIEGRHEARSTYRRLRSESDAPLLVCANHLTLVDSFVVAWALGSPWWYLRNYASLPWNTPDRTTFAATIWRRTVVYLMKCVLILRGSERGEVAEVLEKLGYLLAQGEVVLLFPEGGRSRSGRVEPGSAAYGVGRIVNAIPNCRVLCVYLRGRDQETWSDWPARGERFSVRVSSLEPKSDRAGLRGSVEVAGQIVARLSELEREYFDDRQ